MINKIKNLPNSAGVYQYFDKNGKLLYVGKAKNLKNRVKSYWTFTPTLKANLKLTSHIVRMLEQTENFDYIVVKSENDALILENSLIKQLKPKYNILLRDDKTYPYIYFDKSVKFGRFDITRKVIKSGDIEYFGPFALGARDILESIYEVCMLVQKKSCLNGKKACLYYQIKKCLAPCEFNITDEQYDKEVQKARKFIQNKKSLVKKIEEKMLFYAETLRFEEAAELRDRANRILKSSLNSEIDFAKSENFDIFALDYNELEASIYRIFMRDGKIVSTSYDFIQLKNGIDIDEVYERAIVEFYTKHRPPIVVDILVADDFIEKSFIEQYLHELLGKKIKIINPKRGEKKSLTSLAKLNASLTLKDRSTPKLKLKQEIRELLELENTPFRVECFDNSHMSGRSTVGAMVVYDEDTFIKSDYRNYILESKDEYSQMRELLIRRVESFEKNPPPDLWVIDGGKTLRSLALDIINSSGVNLDVIGISKEKIDKRSNRSKGGANDILHFDGKELKLSVDDKRLHFIQNLRDEAHNHAIQFHRKRKLNEDKESKLLNSYGISEAKVKKLILHFGTFQAIKDANIDEISSILNHVDALALKKSYK